MRLPRGRPARGACRVSVARQRLGGTDVQLSALGFGAAPIGNLY
ncbi:MAG: aldo/keto reductase, partial [Oxalobacteraceae bacterium]